MKSFEGIPYKHVVSALSKPGKNIIEEMTEDKASMLHMSACVMEEVGELILRTSEENTKEELGDILFYLQGIANLLGFTLHTQDNKHVPLRCLAVDVVLFTEASKLYGVMKPWFFYDKSLNKHEAYAQLVTTYHAFCDVLKQFRYTVEEIQAVNRTKLAVRYHKLHYSNEQAQNRADKTDE